MLQPPNRRSNRDWIASLSGEGEDTTAAVRELETYLRRVLGRIVGERLRGGDIAELVQESLARVIEHIESFRGDSAFETWATAIATRVAFTELRRRKVRASPHDAFAAIRADVERLPAPSCPPPDAALSRTHWLATLERAIATELTERQRVAIVAELRGVPTIEIAERLGTNQNALYKLVHDARKKLRQVLVAAGFTIEALHELATEAKP